MAKFIDNTHHHRHKTVLRLVVCVTLFLVVVCYVLLTSTNISSEVYQYICDWYDQVSSSDNSNQTPTQEPITMEQMQPMVLREWTVHTDTGPLKGFVQNVSGVEVGTFLSVPYGQPPVNKLRFRPTEPVQPWTEVRDASQIPPPCIQSEYTQRLFPVHILNENITEDCLFLNIWIPLKGNDSDKLEKKSVMILIHGGLFTIGSIGIDEYDGRMLAAIGDVVVVTIQYRLGLFGFLDMDSPEIPGNMGLFDQFTALQWINQNIQHFGGDPNSITLFGTSAGSISIGFHMFSPKASQLFHRAILQSGSPMLIKQVYSRGEELAEKFATMLNCWTRNSSNASIYDDPQTVIECLDQVPFERIYEVQGKLVENNPIPFMPTIPSDYIEHYISDIEDNVTLHQKEVLMGFNLNEGALMLHAAYPKLYTRHQVPQLRLLKDVQKHVVEMGIDAGLSEPQATTIATLLIKGQEKDTPVRWAQAVADVFSDVMFVCPSYEFANMLYTHNITTYLYLFGQRAQNSAWGEWMQVTHHDEVSFIMGYPLRYPTHYSANDIDISAKMIRTWSHFSKTGTILKKEFPEQWQPYNTLTKQYMQIKADDLRIGANFHNESCNLYSLLADYMN